MFLLAKEDYSRSRRLKTDSFGINIFLPGWIFRECWETRNGGRERLTCTKNDVSIYFKINLLYFMSYWKSISDQSPIPYFWVWYVLSIFKREVQYLVDFVTEVSRRQMWFKKLARATLHKHCKAWLYTIVFYWLKHIRKILRGLNTLKYWNSRWLRD